MDLKVLPSPGLWTGLVTSAAVVETPSAWPVRPLLACTWHCTLAQTQPPAWCLTACSVTLTCSPQGPSCCLLRSSSVVFLILSLLSYGQD